MWFSCQWKQLDCDSSYSVCKETKSVSHSKKLKGGDVKHFVIKCSDAFKVLWNSFHLVLNGTIFELKVKQIAENLKKIVKRGFYNTTVQDSLLIFTSITQPLWNDNAVKMQYLLKQHTMITSYYLLWAFPLIFKSCMRVHDRTKHYECIRVLLMQEDCNASKT